MLRLDVKISNSDVPEYIKRDICTKMNIYFIDKVY